MGSICGGAKKADENADASSVKPSAPMSSQDQKSTNVSMNMSFRAEPTKRISYVDKGLDESFNQDHLEKLHDTLKE